MKWITRERPKIERIACPWLAAPLLACGVLKIAYDLALWRIFRRHQI